MVNNKEKEWMDFDPSSFLAHHVTKRMVDNIVDSDDNSHSHNKTDFDNKSLNELVNGFVDNTSKLVNTEVIPSLKLMRATLLIEAKKTFDEEYLEHQDNIDFETKSKIIMDCYTILKTVHLITEVIGDLEDDCSRVGSSG